MDKQLKEVFTKLSHSSDGKLLREHVLDVIGKLGDISTVDSDPIISRQKAIQTIKTQILEPLTEKTQREHEVDTYE